MDDRSARDLEQRRDETSRTEPDRSAGTLRIPVRNGVFLFGLQLDSQLQDQDQRRIWRAWIGKVSAEM